MNLQKDASVVWADLPDLTGVITMVGTTAPVCTVRFSDGQFRICDNSKLTVMDNEPSVTPEVVYNPVINKGNQLVALDLETDTITTSPTLVFDKQKYIVAIDQMPLDALNNKFIKSIRDAAIAIDKKLYAPIKVFRDDVEEIIAHIEKRTEHLKAEEAAAEEKRKEKKKADVDKLIADLKAKSDLPKEYLDKIVFDDKYYQVTFVNKKLNESIQAQFDTQIALKKGIDDAALVEKVSMEKCQLLLDKLNLQYGYDVQYIQVPYDKYTDEQVIKIYEDKKIRLEAEAKKVEGEQKAKEVIAPVPVEAPAKSEKPILQEPEPELEDDYALPDFGLPEPEPIATPDYPYKIVKVIGASEQQIILALNSLIKYNVSVEYINEI